MSYLSLLKWLDFCLTTSKFNDIIFLGTFNVSNSAICSYSAYSKYITEDLPSLFSFLLPPWHMGPSFSITQSAPFIVLWEVLRVSSSVLMETGHKDPGLHDSQLKELSHCVYFKEGQRNWGDYGITGNTIFTNTSSQEPEICTAQARIAHPCASGI